MAARKKSTVKVAKDGSVSDGRGGYLPRGHDISGLGPDTIESLKAKGLAQ